MSATERMYERDALGVSIPTQTVNGAVVAGAAFDMSKFYRARLFVGKGTGATATISGYLQESDYSNGASATNIAGANTASLVNTANGIVSVEIQAPAMTKRYLVPQIQETQSIATTMWGLLFASDTRDHPQASDAVALASTVVV